MKTYAFIDASNIIYGARAEGWLIDQKKLFQYLKNKFSVSKANCDVDLTMDMLIRIKEYKRAIVLSGDGDFAPLLEYLKSEGKEMIVISAPRITAREIKSLVGGDFVDFGTLRYLLEYKKRGRP